MKTLIFIISLCSFLNASKISQIEVPGMHCPMCVIAVKKAIKDVEGVENVSVKLNTKTATITYDEKVDKKTLLDAIKSTSYEGVILSTRNYKAN